MIRLDWAVTFPFWSRKAVDGKTSANEARLVKLEQQVADAKSSADNAWMLTSAALVLMMTGPGLALFYGGLVRKKNVLATMMQSFAMMAVITVLWALVSYSLAFGPGTSFVGGFHNLFLKGVGASPDPDYAATIPAQTFIWCGERAACSTPPWVDASPALISPAAPSCTSPREFRLWCARSISGRE